MLSKLSKQVDHLGTLMPLLSELRLERGSTLASFRDLGNALANLRVLWLSACGIRHLDGVGALTSLEELYLAFNDVEDLTSIALHDRLEVRDRAACSGEPFSGVRGDGVFFLVVFLRFLQIKKTAQCFDTHPVWAIRRH